MNLYAKNAALNCGNNHFERRKGTMNKEKTLKSIETRISDLDALIKIGSQNESQKNNVEMWQFARNELVLVRDAVADVEESEV